VLAFYVTHKAISDTFDAMFRAARFQNLANVYVKRYPGLKINIDAELAWYKVWLTSIGFHNNNNNTDCQKTPKNAIFATVDLSSIRTVADRHRLAAYHNKHCWQPFRGYQHR